MSEKQLFYHQKDVRKIERMAGAYGFVIGAAIILAIWLMFNFVK